jgi:hypothetical protein
MREDGNLYNQSGLRGQPDSKWKTGKNVSFHKKGDLPYHVKRSFL